MECVGVQVVCCRIRRIVNNRIGCEYSMRRFTASIEARNSRCEAGADGGGRRHVCMRGARHVFSCGWLSIAEAWWVAESYYAGRMTLRLRPLLHQRQRAGKEKYALTHHLGKPRASCVTSVMEVGGLGRTSERILALGAVFTRVTVSRMDRLSPVA